MKTLVTCTVNGEERTVLADTRDTLLELLRDRFAPDRHQGRLRQRQLRHLHGSHGRRTHQRLPGAGAGSAGRDITTIEALSSGGRLHPIQQALVDHGGTQCGFCTPGIVLSAKALLDHNPKPTDEDIRHAIAGNLCRCTGYGKIVEAIAAVAAAVPSSGR